MWDIPLDGVWDNLHMDFVTITKMVGEERLLLVGLGKDSFLTRRINSRYLPFTRAER